MIKTSNCLPLLAFFAVGCAPSDDETGATSQRNDAYDRTSAEIVPTLDDSANLLGGYNSVFDRSLPSCLEASNNGAPYSVGNLEEKYEIKLVTNRNELSKDLNINVGLGLHLPKIELLPTFALSNQIKNTKTSVSFVFAAMQAYNVTNKRGVELSYDAIDAADKSPTAFLKKCGNAYVHGLRYQADLIVLIRFDTISEEKTDEITAGLSGSGASGVIDGNVQTTLKNFARTEGVSASVSVASTGFIASGNSDEATFQTLGTSLDDSTFARIDQLRDAMARSIRNDQCRDGNEGADCSGSTAPGYDKNTLRSARLASIVTRTYESTTDQVDFSTFKANTTTLKNTETFLRDVAKIGESMATARDLDIAPVLAAKKELLPRFNVQGAPKTTTADVLAYAKKYRDAFSGEEGSVLYDLRNISEECASYGLGGDYDRCTMAGVADDIRTPKATLETYKKNRLVALNFLTSDSRAAGTIYYNNKPNAPIGWETSKYYCDNYDDKLGSSPRILKKSEVEYLSPFLKSIGTDDAWFTGGSCGYAPYFDADKKDDSRFSCFDPGWHFWESKSAIGICVPKEGPLGEMTEL